MFSSEISSTDFLLSNNNNNNNNISSADGEFLKSREFNGSDFFQNQNDDDHQSSGLARYRSAPVPSSFLAALLDPNTNTTTDNNININININNSSTSSSGGGDESEADFFSALIDGPGPPRDYLNQKDSMKQDIGVESEPRPAAAGLSPHGGGYVGSYSSVQSLSSNINGDHGNRNCSILVRQTSSPPPPPAAGICFNGFGVMGEVGNYRVRNHAEEASSSAGAFSNDHISFSSGPSPSSRFMPSIPEIGNESISTCIPENGRSENGNGTWNEPTLKRNRDGDLKMFSNFNGLENQNEESRKKPIGLVSHLSLPKTCGVVENYLHFQQETTTVPCQIRAKRGFATHPRSIAERMRRTRISDNMKKLQDLFPNMDKQTNTADMLDLAVEYIKDLQKQVQTLTDTKAKCVCSNKPDQQTMPTT